MIGEMGILFMWMIVRLEPAEESSITMRHTREAVVDRAVREFQVLDEVVARLKDEDWERLAPRPETKDPWTVKDALVHITHWKANLIRTIKKERRPPEERGLSVNDWNHLVYERWRERSPREVMEWHRQVQEELLAALREAPEGWFSGRERSEEWPLDLDGHSAYHRARDIEQALSAVAKK